MEAVPPDPELACDALAQARKALDRLTAVISDAMQTPGSRENADAIIYAGRVVHEMERTLSAHEVKTDAIGAALKASAAFAVEQDRDEREATREDRGQESALRLVSGDSPPRVPRQGVRRVRLMSALPAAAAIVAAVAAGPAHHHHAHVAARTAHAVPAAVQDYDGYVPARP